MPQVQADPNGSVTATIDVSKWADGSYVIAGHGQRSEITGAIAINISEASSASHSRVVTVKALNSTAVQTYLTVWNSSK